MSVPQSPPDPGLEIDLLAGSGMMHAAFEQEDAVGLVEGGEAVMPVEWTTGVAKSYEVWTCPAFVDTQALRQWGALLRVRVRAAAVAIAIPILASGCGGGGGPATSDVRPVQQPAQQPAPQPVQQPAPQPAQQPAPPQVQQDPMPADSPSPPSQWNTQAVGLNAAIENLNRAGVAGFPGAGVTIGFLDRGFDPTHPALRHTGARAVPDWTGHSDGHGTRVVSVAAASPSVPVPHSDILLLGVAYGADIRVAADTVPFALGVRDIISEYAPDIISVSLASTTQPGEESDNDLFRSDYRARIDALTSQGTPPVMVQGAGDGGAPNPSIEGALPSIFEEVRGIWVTAVATKEDGTIWEGSNRCGLAAAWCIAAPGAGVWVANTRDGVQEVGISSGTSLAAPMVAGGLAVMKQRFRSQLSNTELVARLFATANKEPPYDDAAIYGQGFMDLGAATAPVGRPALATSMSVNGPALALAATTIRAGPALGDGISRALSGRAVAAFDELGAPFWFALDGFSATPGPPATRSARIPTAPGDADHLHDPTHPTGPLAVTEGQSHRLQFGVTRPPAASHAAIAPLAPAASFTAAAGISATAFTTSGMADRSDASGATVSWRRPTAAVSLRVGWVGERETLLGTSARGALGGLAGDSVFVGGTFTPDAVDGWGLAASAEVGRTAAAHSAPLVGALSQLTTTAASFSARKALAGGDQVTLSVSQPLRVEAGEARFVIPVGRTPDGDVVRSSFTAPLEPSGRQIDLSVGWRRATAPASSISASISWSRHPGHNVRAKPEMGLFAGFTAGF